MSENHLCTVADVETYISIGEISCAYYYERVNCIDDFFELEGAKVTLATTLEMALYEATMADAWEKEMLNCFDLLKHQTIPDTRPYQELEAELGAYREYVVATVEAELYSNYSDAYSGGDGSTIGSFSKIERMYRRGQHYKQKTLELFDRLYRIGVEPSFIFDSQEYSEILKNSLSVDN